VAVAVMASIGFAVALAAAPPAAFGEPYHGASKFATPPFEGAIP
jgi:hypothetical protein